MFCWAYFLALYSVLQVCWLSQIGSWVARQKLQNVWSLTGESKFINFNLPCWLCKNELTRQKKGHRCHPKTFVCPGLNDQTGSPSSPG